MRKLTPKMTAEIQAARTSGMTYEALSKRFSVSVGSIAVALKSAPTEANTAAKPTVTKAHETDPLLDVQELSAEDLRKLLTRQMRALEADVTNATDPSSRGTLSRTMATMGTLIARLTPAAPPNPNDDVDMIAFGKEVAKRFENALMEAAK
jgi:hypothetical protein